MFQETKNEIWEEYLESIPSVNVQSLAEVDIGHL